MIHAPTQRTQRPAHGVNTPSGHIHPPKRHTPVYGPGGVLLGIDPARSSQEVTLVLRDERGGLVWNPRALEGTGVRLGGRARDAAWARLNEQARDATERLDATLAAIGVTAEQATVAFRQMAAALAETPGT